MEPETHQIGEYHSFSKGYGIIMLGFDRHLHRKLNIVRTERAKGMLTILQD